MLKLNLNEAVHATLLSITPETKPNVEGGYDTIYQLEINGVVTPYKPSGNALKALQDGTFRDGDRITIVKKPHSSNPGWTVVFVNHENPAGPPAYTPAPQQPAYTPPVSSHVSSQEKILGDMYTLLQEVRVKINAIYLAVGTRETPQEPAGPEPPVPPESTRPNENKDIPF